MEMNNKKYKDKVLRVAIAIFSALIVCTIVSAKIYELLLPQIDYIYAEEGQSLKYGGVFTGEIVNTTPHEVIAKENWEIDKIYVDIGEEIKKGDIVAKINIEGFKIEEKRLEALVQKQKNNINSTDWTSGDRLVLLTELQSTEMQLLQVKESYPKNGNIVSDKDGVVNYIARQGNISKGDNIITLDLLSDYSTVKFSIGSNEFSNLINEESDIIATYSVLNSKEMSLNDFEQKLVIKEIKNGDKNGYIDIYGEIDCCLKEVTPIKISITSESDEFWSVVPISCIGVLPDGGNFIYTVNSTQTVLGVKEVVAIQPVIVEKTNGLYAGLKTQISPETKIVFSSSKELSNGCEVRMKYIKD